MNCKINCQMPGRNLVDGIHIIIFTCGWNIIRHFFLNLCYILLIYPSNFPYILLKTRRKPQRRVFKKLIHGFWITFLWRKFLNIHTYTVGATLLRYGIFRRHQLSPASHYNWNEPHPFPRVISDYLSDFWRTQLMTLGYPLQRSIPSVIHFSWRP